MMDQHQRKVISNEWAAFIGIILSLISTVYWLLLFLTGVANIKFIDDILIMLPRNSWIVNFVLAMLTWKINRMSIWIDRFGEWEGLIINKFLMNYAYFLIGVQVIYLISKGFALKFA